MIPGDTITRDKNGRRMCCTDQANRVPYVNPDVPKMMASRCKVCNAKHYTVHAEPMGAMSRKQPA